MAFTCRYCKENVDADSYCNNCGYFCEDRKRLRTSKKSRIVTADKYPSFPIDKLEIAEKYSLEVMLSGQKLLFALLIAIAVIAAFALIVFVPLQITNGAFGISIDSVLTMVSLFTISATSFCFGLKTILKARKLSRAKSAYVLLFSTYGKPLKAILNRKVYEIKLKAKCPFCKDNHNLFFDLDSEKRIYVICDYDDGAKTHMFALDTVLLKESLSNVNDAVNSKKGGNQRDA